MKKEIEKTKKHLSIKQENVNSDESSDSITLQPLLLKQVNKNTKGTRSLPYEFGTETYEVYSNQKNPFMVGILSADTDRIKLDPVSTQNFFQQFEKDSTYSIEYPLNISAHRKRKVARLKKTLPVEKNQENVFKNINVHDISQEYIPKEKLKEDKIKLQTYIQSFCIHFLKRIKDDHDEFALVVNEIVPLFVKNQIRIRFYEAFRQITSIDELISTLEKICSDYELENFELFCSAIFVFYSSIANE